MNNLARIAYLQARAGQPDTPDAVRSVFRGIASDLKGAGQNFDAPQPGLRPLPTPAAGIARSVEPSR